MVCPSIHFSFSLAMQLPNFFASNFILKKNKIRTEEIVNYMLYNYRTNSLKTYGDFLDMVYKDGQIHRLETFCKVLLGAQDLKITREDRRPVRCKNINLLQIGNGANSFENRNLCYAGIKIQLGCSFSH